MPLINTNKLLSGADYYVKSSTNSYVEYQALKFIDSHNLLRLPAAFEYLEESNSVSMSKVEGMLLIQFLRIIRLNPKYSAGLGIDGINNISNEIVGELLTCIRRIQSQFMSHSQQLDITFQKYNYDSKFNECVKQLAAYSQSLSTDEVLIDLGQLTKILDESASVPFLDAASYNVIVEDVTEVNLSETLEDVKSRSAKSILNKLVYIDFETFDQLVTPYDDIALILESSIAQKVNLNNKISLIMDSPTYLYAAFFRNIRNYVRHLEYLLKYPKVHSKIYN